MRLIRGLHRVPPDARRRVVTLGTFDGVHLAHQAICRRVAAAAEERGAEPAALTFYPHPAAVLAPARAPRLLMGIGDRVRLLASTGVRTVIVQRFSPELSRIEAEDFLRAYLIERLGMVQLVVGHSVRFGRGRAGDEALLRRLAGPLGYGIEIVGPLEVGGTVVSSTAIRTAIDAGEIDRANALLGREHFVRGRVMHGHHRGRALGFPSANLRAPRGLLPPDGVYAVRAEIAGRQYDGVANIGFNPTFGDAERAFEVHLLDFSGDLYGRGMRASFVRRLRSEMRFPSPEALARQIAHDVAAARAALHRR